MTLETILLHAPAGHADPARGPAAWALGLASALGARLTAVVFDSDASTGGPLETRRPPRQEGETASCEAAETAARLRRAAADLGIDVNVVTERSFAYGLPEVVADHARLHDLVVTGVNPAGLLSERAMAEHLVFEAGRPVVIVPTAHEAPFRCERIAVGWDNSRAASRALGDAMPLLRRASEVFLVTVGDEKAIDTSLREIELVEAQKRRGAPVTYERVELSRRRIGDVLAEHARERGADLIVMGAYGHSRLRQFVLGGATRSALHASCLPVLLSH